MSTNFEFLKKSDKNLYEIITDAEKLYRDEYFEQCMGQTRRFAESVCKSVLGEKYALQNSFDEMLATLKDKSKGSEQEKEFIDDLYFLKQQGNRSLHSSKVKQDGLVALECLQRAFEVALNYCVFAKGEKRNILKSHYDVELLVTGKRNKSLAARYEQKKTQLKTANSFESNSSKIEKPRKQKQNTKSKIKTISNTKKSSSGKRKSSSSKKQGFSFFKFFITTAFWFSMLVIAAIVVISRL